MLIRHRHEPPNSPAIEYYSLYMHLAPFKVYDAKYDKNEVSIFKRWECQIKNPRVFRGNSLRNAAGDIIRAIPWGGAVSIVEEEGVLYNGEAMPNTRKKAVCTLWGSEETGFIWIADFNQTTWRCTSRGRTARNADKGALVHRTADPTSEVIRILPAGTRIYFEEPYQSVSKEGTIRPGMAGIKLDLESSVLGYIDVTTSTIETVGKVIDPVLSDEMQPCEIDVHAGEIIGWPGKDGVCANNSFHFEIFTKDEHVNGSNGFWEIESDQGQPDGVYKIAKDTPFFRMKKNDPIANKTIPKHTILELVGAVDSYGSFPKANARQIKVVNSQVGWVLKDELGWLSATGSNVGEAKYHLTNDALRWFWKQKPTASTSTREIYMGLRKTYQGNNVELVLEEEGTAGTDQIRKIRYTLTPTLHFNGWVANEDSIAGKSYTDNGVKKKRFYATEDITAVYNRNPEYAVFQPSSQKAAHDIYIFKKDCIQAKDGNGDVWTGFPKPFIQSGEIFFDKEEFDEIKNWVWLKGDESAFTKMNIFDWNEFFQQCSENAFTGGEDGFCDAVTVFEFIDADKDGTFTDCEIKNAVRHATVKHQLRRLVCEYPSSWFLPSSAANKDLKWGNRLKGPRTNPDEPWYQQVYNRIKEWKDGAKPPRYGFNFSEEKYAAFLELVEKTCFLQQIDGFTEDETLWHFHPIAFVQHLKRLFADSYKIILEVTRKKQWAPQTITINSSDSARTKRIKNAVLQGATTSDFKLFIDGEVKMEGAIIEPAGQASLIADSDRRITAGEYFLIKNPGRNQAHKFRLVKKTKDEATQYFGNRGAVNIHKAWRSNDVEGCLGPGEKAVVRKIDGKEYPEIINPDVLYPKFVKLIQDNSRMTTETTYDGFLEYSPTKTSSVGVLKVGNNSIYADVKVIIKEDF